MANMIRLPPYRMSPPSPEMLRLASLCIAKKEAEERMLAAMTPEDRDAYVTQWAARLARDLCQHTD